MLASQAAQIAKEKCETLDVQVFSDRDIDSKRDRIQAALESADVFFGSLLFDYDQVRVTAASWTWATTDYNFPFELVEALQAVSAAWV